MNSQRFVTFLVVALPVLVVAFAVLMGGYALSVVAQDAAGARVLWWVAMVCIMLLVMNVILLVGLLGFEHLRRSSQQKTDFDQQA
ncbi:MAG: hypothetical protein P8N76_01025 [Pirellulaceae bacterium]|nr:hypothetical protein [Pirellulaceae bacterium]